MALVLAAAACATTSRTGRDAPAPAPDATPVEVTRAFYGALHAGDAAAAGKLIASPRGPAAAESFVKMAGAYQLLEAALQERFGPAAAHTVGYADRVAAEDAALRDARGAIEGERATVTSGDHALARLERVSGAWRVVLDDRLSTDEGVSALARDASASRRAAERVAPAIRAGLFDDPEDALEAFRNEVSVATQGGDPELPRPPAARPGGVTL